MSISVSEVYKNEILDNKEFMFDIIYNNMLGIVDTKHSKEEDYVMWSNSLEQNIENEKVHFYFAYDDSKLVGYFIIGIDGNNIYLNEIELDKIHQGDKVTANMLLKVLFDFDGDYTLRAYANRNNVKSNALLKKLSFEVIEEKKNGYLYSTSLNVFKDKLNDRINEFNKIRNEKGLVK